MELAIAEKKFDPEPPAGKIHIPVGGSHGVVVVGAEILIVPVISDRLTVVDTRHLTYKNPLLLASRLLMRPTTIFNKAAHHCLTAC